ncbi:GMC family oxidoreductase [Antrihabitans stalactiti]|uniref:FAD-binding protein n=1 Tax=Antrihabitans stalactiti TaxID=2584121 RepID=A0A848KRK5_9NOCA|nr:FAD-dependent oxidoreductase [Antrihabitans stalactiti]NMN99192.1 FAD-binding protein [Antrihabitans stalactiti]
MSRNYDYIVIGAGSGGCAVAARLSEDRSARVLLIEAGGSNRKLEVKAPLAFAKQFHSKLDWDYWSEPEPHLNGRRIFSPRGKMLGGCSSMNAMIYIRGNRLDYDTWAANGADGWSYNDVLPYFVRAERNEHIHDQFHGKTGPLNVTRVRDVDPVSVALVDAAADALNIPENNDFNGASQDGVGQFQVTQRRGIRFSAREAYLRARRRNLTIRTNTLVHKILLDNGRATGVEVADDKGNVERITASREVILAAGAFNTPALLQHSGIGPAEHLRSVGVEPIVDLPAVGEHLMEHPLVYLTYELSNGHVGLFDAEDPRHLKNWLLHRRGKLASNVAETGGHIRSDSALAAPNFQILFAPAFFYNHGAMAWDTPAATIAMSYIAPSSRGRVRIRTSDPTRKPAVTYNMLGRDSEMEEMIDAVELARRIAASAPARGVLGAEITPGAAVQSRADIAAWIRSTVQHTYHPSCTARIGSPTDGVVDPQLRVHGVPNLRIADASVMPTIIRGNTNATAIMIGERCADFVRADLATAPVKAGRVSEVGAR